MGTRSVWEGDSWERRWIVTKVRGKTEKDLKLPLFLPNTHFSLLKWVAIKSPGQAAKTLKGKILKNFLSIFRNWKVYPRESRELSCENLWVTLATGPFTREQVAKIDPQTRDWGLRLDLPANELPKQGKNYFLKFSDFENKILSKNTKNNQKSFCAWINKDWACENIFHQVQSHK